VRARGCETARQKFRLAHRLNRAYQYSPTFNSTDVTALSFLFTEDAGNYLRIITVIFQQQCEHTGIALGHIPELYAEADPFEHMPDLALQQHPALGRKANAYRDGLAHKRLRPRLNKASCGAQAGNLSAAQRLVRTPEDIYGRIYLNAFRFS
jgi:hypothetical protein